MRRLGSGLWGSWQKCVGKSLRISEIRAELVFRDTEDKCAHNPNKISALPPELVFREVPGKFVQWRWRAEGLGSLFLLIALGDSMCGCVAGVASAPTGLRLLTARLLAIRFPAGMLAVADSDVWPEPAPTT